jgi:hypothetical protein
MLGPADRIAHGATSRGRAGEAREAPQLTSAPNPRSTVASLRKRLGNGMAGGQDEAWPVRQRSGRVAAVVFARAEVGESVHAGSEPYRRARPSPDYIAACARR